MLMTPLERAARALCRRDTQSEHNWGMWVDDARAVIEAIREPIAEASVYLKADAEAWELGAKDAPHEVYLMECGRLRRFIAQRLDALLEEGR